MPNDDNLPQRLADLEQRYRSFINILSRMFDLDPSRIEELAILIAVRDVFKYAGKMAAREREIEEALDMVRGFKAMKEPTFDEIMTFNVRAYKAEESKAKAVSSVLRLVIAGVIGTVMGGVALWKITGHS